MFVNCFITCSSHVHFLFTVFPSLSFSYHIVKWLHQDLHSLHSTASFNILKQSKSSAVQCTHCTHVKLTHVWGSGASKLSGVNWRKCAPPSGTPHILMYTYSPHCVVCTLHVCTQTTHLIRCKMMRLSWHALTTLLWGFPQKQWPMSKCFLLP